MNLEYPTYRFAYFMKSRDEAYDCVRDCVARINRDTGKSVRNLVRDRGSEFTSKRTQEYLKTMKIARIVSAPHTPEQNGMIERYNRTAMNSVRSMLHHNKLDDKLWGEALNTAIYLLNRVPNTHTKEVTPYERYFKRKPRVSHLKVLRCIAYMKAQEKKRSGYQRKLEPRAQAFIMVGYERDFTYRVYDPSTDKVIVSREVLFDETKTLRNCKREDDTSTVLVYLDKLISNVDDHVISQDTVDDHVVSQDTVHDDDVEAVSSRAPDVVGGNDDTTRVRSE